RIGCKKHGDLEPSRGWSRTREVRWRDCGELTTLALALAKRTLAKKTTTLCQENMERAMADGLTTVRSSHGPKDTMNRIEAEVKARGMSVFARIDHAAGAAAVELSLRPTEVIIFGNAKGGTPLMQLEQTIGIDLPLK